MELWIRSQDKTRLVKVNYVYMTENNDHLTIYGETIDSAPIVGTYKTKERALEVLDEIQDILKPKYILDASSIKPDGNFYEENGMIFQKYNANAEIKELSTFVYQMPEK